MIYKKPNYDSLPVAKVEPRALLTLEACELNWCEVSASNLSGWISYEKLWGVYEGEQFK
jgi:SH3-like domain-containing protein